MLETDVDDLAEGGQINANFLSACFRFSRDLLKAFGIFVTVSKETTRRKTFAHRAINAETSSALWKKPASIIIAYTSFH